MEVDLVLTQYLVYQVIIMIGHYVNVFVNKVNRVYQVTIGVSKNVNVYQIQWVL